MSQSSRLPGKPALPTPEPKAAEPQLSVVPDMIRVLIVEDDADLRELLKMTIQVSLASEVTEAVSLADAQTKLKSSFDCVIIDYHCQAGRGGQLLAAVPTATPVVLIAATEVASRPDAIPEFPARKGGPAPIELVDKTLIVTPLLETLTRWFPSSSTFDLPGNSQYVEIRIETLRKINSVPCDLYLRLSDRKFVKVFHRGDGFGEEDLARFLKKNTPWLWLLKDELTDFLSTLTKEITSLLSAKDLSPGHALETSQALYQTVQEAIDRVGMTPETRTLIRASVDLAMKSIKSRPKLSELIRNIDANPEHYLSSHCVLLSHISCWMASLMSWNSELTHYKLAMASLLHDITLTNPDLAQIESVEELVASPIPFSREDVQAFREHPEAVAKLLKEFPDLPDDIALVVVQHHERPNGRGFPQNLTAKQINPLASLFIIAHDFVRYLLHTKKAGNLQSFLDQHEQNYSGAHFKRIISVLKAASRA